MVLCTLNNFTKLANTEAIQCIHSSTESGSVEALFLHHHHKTSPTSKSSFSLPESEVLLSSASHDFHKLVPRNHFVDLQKEIFSILTNTLNSGLSSCDWQASSAAVLMRESLSNPANSRSITKSSHNFQRCRVHSPIWHIVPDFDDDGDTLVDIELIHSKIS
ncbi:hypothetical protein RF11_15623 [Thelohanellus kitauei]|uniref:Uncharacterized protein n=1 Tax=Thelohanellus kitauei TaxID=669202 RepID=A0A0C2N2N6_THEKT|nr:hypothetical protein RF11_15623 [Thelohanellus kitauei]